ncbi:MAG: hypothetical protein LC795_09880, partial [Acidobacteria bacterium]|nr:hypothetical protein [Acidobacteriota bacterium]
MKKTDYIDLDDIDDISLLGSGPDHKSNTIHVEEENEVKFKQDLWVRVLAIEEPEAGRRMVLVGVDVAVFERSFVDEVRDLVRGYKGLRPGEVMLNASHTHSAPSLKLYCPGATCPIDLNGENIDNAPLRHGEHQHRQVQAQGRGQAPAAQP